MIFPAHDYKGETVSTIGEEKAFNPRLQVKSIDQYVELMNNLNLPNPKMMDVAVPANMRVGLAQEAIAQRGWAVSAAEAMTLSASRCGAVDLRERTEREKHGVIAGSLHAPYPDLAANVRPGGMLNELARATGKRIVFYCAFGERSAMAVQAAQDAGLASACHIQGGIDAWKKAGGSLVRPVPTCRGSAAISFGELCGVVELAELGDLAVANRENVHPIAGHCAAGLADFPGVVAEHEDPILGGEELARRELGRLLVLGDALEEFLHLGRPFPAADSG